MKPGTQFTRCLSEQAHRKKSLNPVSLANLKLTYSWRVVRDSQVHVPHDRPQIKLTEESKKLSRGHQPAAWTSAQLPSPNTAGRGPSGQTALAFAVPLQIPQVPAQYFAASSGMPQMPNCFASTQLAMFALAGKFATSPQGLQLRGQ